MQDSAPTTPCLTPAAGRPRGSLRWQQPGRPAGALAGLGCEEEASSGQSGVGWTRRGPQGDREGRRKRPQEPALLRTPTGFQTQLFLLLFPAPLFPRALVLSSSFPPCRKWSVRHVESVPQVFLLTSQVKYAVIRVIIHLGWISSKLPFVLQ